MKSNIDDAYNKILLGMTHMSFICFAFGYAMGLIGFLINNHLSLVIEDTIVISILIITYVCFLFKKIDIRHSMMILSFLVVADMVYPGITSPDNTFSDSSMDLGIIMLFDLVVVVAFTTNRAYSIFINVFIIINLVLYAIVNKDSAYVEKLPIIILCLSGLGFFSIIFERLIKKLRTQANKSKSEIQELSNYKQNIIRLIIHDLKVPVNTILNLSNNSKVEGMKRINTHIENINKQLENVLEIERLQEPEIRLCLEEVSVNEIIEHAINEVDLFLDKKNIRIRVDFKMECKLICDVCLIERTIVNLLVNAIKYSSINDVITISVDLKDNFCKISIIDQGTGIAEEHLQNIFKKFYVINDGKSKINSSTGLGLSFCKLSVEAHGGQITVKSKLKRGSEFQILLPYSGLLEQQHDEAKFDMNNITFSEMEEQLIERIIDHIKDVPIYNVSELIILIENILENPSDNLARWKENITDAIYTGNQKRFDEMMKFSLVPVPE